ncbi:MAG: PAS domain S-box protein, partial [Pirellulales bacterium]|nr:PAS domain S-box protein [Pirellulales bacterium]
MPIDSAKSSPDQIMSLNENSIESRSATLESEQALWQLAQELEHTNKDLLAVNQLHAELFDCTSVNQVAETLTNALVRDFSAYFSRVWLIRPGDLCPQCALSESCSNKERCLHLVASAGHYTHIDGDHRRVPLGMFKIGLIAQGRGKTICNDVVNDERVHNREWAAEHNLQSFAGFPFVRNGETIGVMAMFSQKEFSRHLMATIELLAQLGTSAISIVEKAESLRQSKDYANNIFHSMVNSLIVTTPDGTIISVNEATCQLLGYTEDELVGKPSQMIFEEEEEEGEEALVQAILSQGPLPCKMGMLRTLISAGQVRDLEGWYVAKDGSRIPVNFSGSVMLGSDGKIQGIVCVVQDNTKQKKLQCELAHAQKLESVGQLAAGIAHEINTPIQYVGDNTRFLEEAFGDMSGALD